VPSRTFKAALLAMTALCAAPAIAQDNAGSYLAGRQAAASNDFNVVETYFREALREDASNPFLLETHHKSLWQTWTGPQTPRRGWSTWA